MDAGEYKMAEQRFKDALKSDPDNARAMAGLAELDMHQTKWPRALKKLNALVKDHPEYLYGIYLRGVTHREIAKFRALNQKRHWDASLKDFKTIISRDSLFKDVSYQFALWHRYQGFYPQAIAYADDQVRLKPDSLELAFHLYNTYRYYLRNTESTEARAWLTEQDHTYNRYFVGETLRREGKFEEAEDLFKQHLIGESEMASQPVLLSLARIYYSQGSPLFAQSYFQQAIDSIENWLHARLILEDIKYLLRDDELHLFNSLTTPEEWSAFFKAFWAQRDPTPARPENVRMTEHYRRLLFAEHEYEFDGFRLWHNNPDRLGALKFPQSYSLNEEFNDKGLIFIRHGKPYDTEIHVGSDLEYRSVIDNTTTYGSPVEYSSSQGSDLNESWRYVVPRRMDFHFVLAGGGPNSWRLVPELIDMDVLISREHWGPLYHEMANAARALNAIQGTATADVTADATILSLDEETQSEFAGSGDSTVTTASSPSSIDMGMMGASSRAFLEFSSLQRQMVDESVAFVELALTTDQHTWEEEIESLPMPFEVASFKGDGDSTRIEVYFALPIGRISKEEQKTSGSIQVEMGYAVHDTSWHEVDRNAIAKRLPAHEEEDAAAVDFFSFSVPADSYYVSIFSRPLKTTQLSGYKFEYNARDYSTTAFTMSDLLMADYIGPAQSGSRFDRGALHVSPNPFNRYATSQSVFLYFELYNLTLDSDDQGQFSVEYILTGQQTKRRLIRRKNKPLLTLQIDRTSDTISPIEYAEIDVNSVDPGQYELTVRVTDKNTGLSQERSRTIELYEE